jgi:hypothetical protein
MRYVTQRVARADAGPSTGAVAPTPSRLTFRSAGRVAFEAFCCLVLDAALDLAAGELFEDVARVGQRSGETIKLGHDQRVG